MTGATADAVKHPAKYTPSVLDAIRDVVDAEAAQLGRPLDIIDPFAGIGGIHALDGHNTTGVEIEPEWAAAHPANRQGDATNLPFPAGSFDAMATSPCYGNRMADTYDGRDGSRRMTYRLSLGHDLDPSSAAGLQWGPAYRDLHRAAWLEAMRVVRPGGLLIVNVSNHIRGGDEQPVVEWHLRTLLELGAGLVEARAIGTPRYRHGANHGARVDAERLLVLRNTETAQAAFL